MKISTSVEYNLLKNVYPIAIKILVIFYWISIFWLSLTMLMQGVYLFLPLTRELLDELPIGKIFISDKYKELVKSNDKTEVEILFKYVISKRMLYIIVLIVLRAIAGKFGIGWNLR